MTERLRVEGLTKRFGPVVANDGVGFAVAAGELHCLLGENGAGKSTLLGLIHGALQPDAGTIFYDGRPVRLRSPADAGRLGIAIVHQHFVLIPRFTVLDNVTLGARACGLDLGAAEARARVERLIGELGLPLDPMARVESLSVGEQQWVEILKALYLDARLLLLDEPTAVLTPQESARLFAMIERVTARGVAVLLISHKLDEVLRADRVTVLRQGRVVGAAGRGEATRARLAELMVGHSVRFAPERTARALDPAPRLELRAVVLDGRAGRAPPLSLTIRRGEILGIAGIAGNGQDELFEALAGVRHALSGDILLDGEPIGRLDPPGVARCGVGYVPADRYRDGLVGSLSLADNLLLGRQHERPCARWGLLDRRRIRDGAAEAVRRFGITPPAIRLAAARLSGGNAQKLILARELERATKCLLCHQPARGLDVGVIELVHELILAKRDAGCAVLLASEELDELIALADRILVLSRGEIMGLVDPAACDRQAIGLMMAGQRAA